MSSHQQGGYAYQADPPHHRREFRVAHYRRRAGQRMAVVVPTAVRRRSGGVPAGRRGRRSRLVCRARSGPDLLSDAAVAARRGLTLGDVERALSARWTLPSDDLAEVVFPQFSGIMIDSVEAIEGVARVHACAGGESSGTFPAVAILRGVVAGQGGFG